MTKYLSNHSLWGVKKLHIPLTMHLHSRERKLCSHWVLEILHNSFIPCLLMSSSSGKQCISKSSNDAWSKALFKREKAGHKSRVMKNVRPHSCPGMCDFHDAAAGELHHSFLQSDIRLQLSLWMTNRKPSPGRNNFTRPSSSNLSLKWSDMHSLPALFDIVQWLDLQEGPF